MSKLSWFSRGYNISFSNCPFCGSVDVDFNGDEFNCPDCGAVVRFRLPENLERPICDGPSDSEKYIRLWNERKGEEITVNDIYAIAKATVDDPYSFHRRDTLREVWKYINDSADFGKFYCEIPVEFIEDPDYFKEKGFVLEKRGHNWFISWARDSEE